MSDELNENQIEVPNETQEEAKPETFTKEDVEALIAQRTEQIEAQVSQQYQTHYEQQMQQLQARLNPQKQEEPDLQEMLFQDPARAIQMIEERTANRIMQQVAPQLHSASRFVIENQLLSGLPEPAQEAARTVLRDIDPAQLSNLNEQGLKALRQMAIGQAYEDGKLAPAPIQQGGRGSGRGDVLNLKGGLTREHIDGYNRMLSDFNKKITVDELREEGYVD